MIFDCEKVTKLVVSWQRDNNVSTLAEIMTETQPMVEAIVSGYEQHYRDDLIQECFLRLQYALPYYDNHYSLHNFFTTVIRNSCATFLKKHRNELLCSSNELEVEVNYGEYDMYKDNQLLVDLLVRNRKRFPSLPVDVIDSITSMIYTAFTLDEANSKELIRKIVAAGIQRSHATVIYQSTLVWMRRLNISFADFAKYNDGEFNILTDLQEVLDDENYKAFRIIMAGMTIHISV